MNFTKPNILRISVTKDAVCQTSNGLHIKESLLANLNQDIYHVLALTSDHELLGSFDTTVVKGSDRDWHMQALPGLVCLYKPVETVRTAAVNFILTDELPNDNQQSCSSDLLKTFSNRLKIARFPLVQFTKSILLVWLGGALPNGMYVMHANGVGVDETEISDKKLLIPNRVIQPNWIAQKTPEKMS